MKRILLIEDDPEVARLVEAELKEAGFQVDWAKTGMEGLIRHREGKPDLVVLDLGLPDLDGAEVARRIRATDDTPILVLTAQDAVDRKVSLLTGGADDYLVKPFHLEELLARVRALLRRASEVKASRVRLGPLEVDLAGRGVYLAGRRVDLSLKEFALLETLLLHPGRVFAPEELAERVFGDPEKVGAVKVYVHYLRQKLFPEVVRTVPGGYRLGHEP